MRISEWILLSELARLLLKDEDGTETETIGKMHSYDVTECCHKIIQKYIQSSDVSWQHVLQSLRKANHNIMARSIAEDIGMYNMCVIMICLNQQL